MKKGPLNFLSRKNQNLFDTNVEIKEMGHLEFLDSAAVPESGTARVRSRPAVRHIASTDSIQGFAVPTPKVPLMPSYNGSTTNLHNGGMISVNDMFEGEIFIPPPPSSAPPPPPSSSAAPPPPSFIPPPPSRNLPDNVSLQPPPVPPPKPPSLNDYEYGDDIDMASLRPPPMAPPKPPSDTSSFRGSISSLDVQEIPDCPKFTPPPPPSTAKPPPVIPKTQKMPPPKPVRMSSISNLEMEVPMPSYVATPPAAAISTPSSFKPQNTAKLYSVSKSTLLTLETDREKQVQPILLLEDSSGNPVGGYVNGNNGGSFPVVPPVKPARRGSNVALLDNDIPDGEARSPIPAKPEINPEPVPVTRNTPSEAPTPNIENHDQVKNHMDLPSSSHRSSPILSRNLRTRGLETSGKKETPLKSASPLALLMAAKERDKRNSLSRQSSTSSESSAINPVLEKPNSFNAIHQDSSVRPGVKLNTQPVIPLSTKVDVTDGLHQTKPVLSSTPFKSSAGVRNLPVRDAESGEVCGDVVMFIPPPPEFANSDSEDEPPAPPPSHRAPLPPVQATPPPSHRAPSAPVQATPPPSHRAPSAPVQATLPPSHRAPVQATPPPSHRAPQLPVQATPPPTHRAPLAPVQAIPPPFKPSVPPPTTNGPLISPKPKPPNSPPKPPGPPPSFQPKPPVQIKPSPPSAPTPPPVSGQTSLMSILQKKMLEMDPKFSAIKETESNDDWNSPLSDDEGTSSPVVSKPFQIPSAAPPAKSQGVDMKELENKVAKKAQDLTSKPQNSNGASSKPFGMTFIVRPGTKQPITPVIKN